MDVNFARRLPLLMLFGLSFARADAAVAVAQQDQSADRLFLIAETALHGANRGNNTYGSAALVPSGAPLFTHENTGQASQEKPVLAGSQAQISADGQTNDGVAGGTRNAAGTGMDRPGGTLASWAAVPAHQLDDIRGGFDTSLNLTLSFGIERAVYLNGALVTTTSFNLPALGSLPRNDANGAILSAGSVALVQNGPGNTFVQARDSTPLAATVIQNTLSNQSLQSLTTINASSNSLQILRTNAFQSMLQDGVGRMMVPH